MSVVVSTNWGIATLMTHHEILRRVMMDIFSPGSTTLLSKSDGIITLESENTITGGRHYVQAQSRPELMSSPSWGLAPKPPLPPVARSPDPACT